MLGSLFDKVAGLETPTQVFSCEICEIFKNTYSEENIRWLLLPQATSQCLLKIFVIMFKVLQHDLENFVLNILVMLGEALVNRGVLLKKLFLQVFQYSKKKYL